MGGWLLVASVGCGETPAATALDRGSVPATELERVLVVVAEDDRVRSVGRAGSGATRLHFINRRREAHRLEVRRIQSGPSPLDFWKEVAETGAAPTLAPAVAASRTLAPGEDAQLRVWLTAGRYVVLCTLASPGHPSHFTRGLGRAIRVER